MASNEEEKKYPQLERSRNLEKIKRDVLGSEDKEKVVRSDRLQRDHFLKPDSDQIDLDLLLDAVLDINDKLSRQENGEEHLHTGEGSQDSKSMFSDKSSTKMCKSFNETPKRRGDRQNFSFRNEEVLAIDTENQRLLRAISRPRPRSAPSARVTKSSSTEYKPFRLKTSSEVNRKRLQRRIDEENQVLLRRLESVKPGEYLLRCQTAKPEKAPSRAASACMKPRTKAVTSKQHFDNQDVSHESGRPCQARFSKSVYEDG